MGLNESIFSHIVNFVNCQKGSEESHRKIQTSEVVFDQENSFRKICAIHLPVGRSRHRVVGRQLQRVNDAQQLPATGSTINLERILGPTLPPTPVLAGQKYPVLKRNCVLST